MLFTPLEAWQYVEVTERRTMISFAECIRDLVKVHFAEAKKIVLMVDNFNTRKLTSLYKASEPAEARRIIEKLKIHYTELGPTAQALPVLV